MLIDKTDRQNKKSDRTFSALMRWPAAVLCLSFFFFASSCATQSTGKLLPSAEITKIFEDHQILPDYFYYYSGLQGVPDALIGIHTNYSLRIDQWQQVDLTSLTLKTWIFRMQAVQLMRPQGAWILDTEGNRVGIWFSGLRQTAVRLQKNNRVVIVPPKPPKLQDIR
jgi:hypothetical protein